jgi:hypothetical protein
MSLDGSTSGRPRDLVTILILILLTACGKEGGCCSRRSSLGTPAHPGMRSAWQLLPLARGPFAIS